MADLTSLLTSSRALTSHVTRPDLPSINLGLDQIEAQSRRLVSRQPTSSLDSGKANYLLAKANVDAPALSSNIAAFNTNNTFSPLNPLHDTDVAGYLRHQHEQTLISAIEEGRRETEEEFYRVLQERSRLDWDNRKKKIFEKLGVGMDVQGQKNEGDKEGRTRFVGVHANRKSARAFNAKPPPQPVPTLAMHNKMMVYDRVVTQLNSSRLAGTPFPLIASFIDAARSTTTDSTQMIQTLEILHLITAERPHVPLSHTQAHTLNAPVLERTFARAYLGPADSPATKELRTGISNGARQALENQYWEIVERTLQQNQVDALLGGDPSPANKIRAYVSLRYYKAGRWESRLELINGTPLWAKIFFLIRTGHLQEALAVAQDAEKALQNRERRFTALLESWIRSPDRRLTRQHRDLVMSTYNTELLHTEADPFKIALYKLLGRIDPQRRTVQYITTTTEDWIWFQLAMADESQESRGTLEDLAQTLEGYGEKHFNNAPDERSRKSLWARLLLICGLFEKAVATLYSHVELQIEAVHLAIALSYYGLLRIPSRAESSDVDILNTSPGQPSTLNFSLLMNRYIRQFQRTDPKEALQYAYCVCLNADRGGSNEQKRLADEQVETARELVRRIVLGCDGKWDELVGGFREDGTRYPGLIERNLSLLHFKNIAEYNTSILLRTAEQSEEDRRLLDAIKLYNLAGSHDTVIRCLTHAIGDCLSEPAGGGEDGKELDTLARNVLDHYTRRGDVLGKAREDLVKLLKVREAMEACEKQKYDAALEAIISSGLVPLEGDIPTLTRRAEEFKEENEAITRNMSEILLLTMNILYGIHQRVKQSLFAQSARQNTLDGLKQKARALSVFAGMQRYRMSADVYGQLTRLEVAISH